ncbi:MAG: GtrA family protein [Pseudohongiellaceae bacterium]
MHLALLYGFFAAISILINILGQELSLQIYSASYALPIAVAVGTLTGLISKYLLDKRYIFKYRSLHIADDIRTFSAYTLTGAGTTLLFWAFEFGFEFLFATRMARYTGAVIGLTLGYLIKYQLDKRLVFIRPGQ